MPPIQSCFYGLFSLREAEVLLFYWELILSLSSSTKTTESSEHHPGTIIVQFFLSSRRLHQFCWLAVPIFFKFTLSASYGRVYGKALSTVRQLQHWGGPMDVLQLCLESVTSQPLISVPSEYDQTLMTR